MRKPPGPSAERRARSCAGRERMYCANMPETVTLEDVEAFARDLGGDVTFTRLAVTPAQIRQYRLPTAPPKKEDNRAFRGQTCQAEALAPDVLADILRTAIEARIDQGQLDRVLKRERQVRQELVRKLAGR